jgi:transposase
LDTTSLTLQGDYPEAETVVSPNPDEILPSPVISIPKALHGYSKDHRPDLKQVVLSLTTSGEAGFPIWMEALNGNSSDKTSFHETITKVKEFQKQLQQSTPFIWVADSALYTVDKLLNFADDNWITRVPNTIVAVKNLCEAPEEQFQWREIENGYKMVGLGSNYGGLKQRWILIQSQQAFKRESATFEKNMKNREEKLTKEIWHLGNQIFSTKKEAKDAFIALNQTAYYHKLDYFLQPVRKYSGKGRPKAGQKPKLVGYLLKVIFSRNENAIAIAKNAKGRFILATNHLDLELLSDLEVFQEYKKQSQVEGGFRFLKDPWFMIDSVFLKNPARIGALMMVMTLCLMVYNVSQFRLRELLKKNEDTLPNQVGKPTQNPTLRWVFRLMEGISVVHLALKGFKNKSSVFIANLDEVKRKIIGYFGSYALEIYGLT